MLCGVEGRVTSGAAAAVGAGTDELSPGLGEGSTTALLVSELVMISIVLISSVPALRLGFVPCEESVSRERRLWIGLAKGRG